MLGIWFTPESPRWLMKHGKYDKAFHSFLRLRSHPIIAARDYYYSHVIYQEELHLAKGSNYFSRLWDCFKVPRIRRANYGASTVMIAQQMCGINSTFSFPPLAGFNSQCFLVISFYSSTIFTDVGYTDTQALYASLGYGAVQVVFTIPTLFMIDTVGRRRLCLIVSHIFRPLYLPRLTLSRPSPLCVSSFSPQVSLSSRPPEALGLKLVLSCSSSTSSPFVIPSVKDPSLSSTLQKSSLLFSENRVWLGPCSLTTSLVCL